MEDVALLESQGQSEASLYPVWFLHFQMDVARKRINSHYRTQATLFQAAMVAAQDTSKVKKGLKSFTEVLESLDG